MGADHQSNGDSARCHSPLQRLISNSRWVKRSFNPISTHLLPPEKLLELYFQEGDTESNSKTTLTWLSSTSCRDITLLSLPHTAYSSTTQHQCQRWREDHVRLDRDQGCRTSICQFGMQEGGCGSQQAVSLPSSASVPQSEIEGTVAKVLLLEFSSTLTISTQSLYEWIADPRLAPAS